MKKIISFLMISIMLISSFSITCYANETIKIGGVDESFVEILQVDNGVTYLPIRVIFTNLNTDKYLISIEPFMYANFLRISMARIGSDGKIINGKARCVEVIWDDKAKNKYGGKGKVNAYVYSKENGHGHTFDFDFEKFGFKGIKNNELYYGVKTQKVNGGERVFLSLEDLNRIIKFLVDNSNYEVELK